MDEIAQFVADKSVEILKTGEEVHAFVFSLKLDETPPGLVIVPVPSFETDEEKRRAYGYAMGAARAAGSPRLLVLTDTWFSTKHETEVEAGDFVRPSEDPNRQEALLLSDSTVVGVKTYMNVYSRDGDGNPIPSEWEEVPAMDGMMMDLLTSATALPDAPPEVMAELEGFIEKL